MEWSGVGWSGVEWNGMEWNGTTNGSGRPSTESISIRTVAEIPYACYFYL